MVRIPEAHFRLERRSLAPAGDLVRDSIPVGIHLLPIGAAQGWIVRKNHIHLNDARDNTGSRSGIEDWYRDASIWRTGAGAESKGSLLPSPVMQPHHSCVCLMLAVHRRNVPGNRLLASIFPLL
jgi:hypothetical protein